MNSKIYRKLKRLKTVMFDFFKFKLIFKNFFIIYGASIVQDRDSLTSEKNTVQNLRLENYTDTSQIFFCDSKKNFSQFIPNHQQQKCYLVQYPYFRYYALPSFQPTCAFFCADYKNMYRNCNIQDIQNKNLSASNEAYIEDSGNQNYCNDHFKLSSDKEISNYSHIHSNNIQNIHLFCDPKRNIKQNLVSPSQHYQGGECPKHIEINKNSKNPKNQESVHHKEYDDFNDKFCNPNPGQDVNVDIKERTYLLFFDARSYFLKKKGFKK
ncbi:hypothetical protein EDEG_02895 [Edhazardia aedis USNM 41457]|uniref:Uncharacterized protein n=1 Tax=Edhazardia aedis (strain USNM 41457) TaxID=1003232 RepID=J9D4I0_EDHAE|nr:hypothetical protein EDEG_02895 [Edhazardia aedis USNM 41457]|eukprot:EJW02711.1 hypothetical protein EDEG_02895 [Edhazardia aedis USNM 41457]